MSEKKDLCAGCRNNFYNQPGKSTSGECWSLKSAKVVTRYKLGWWTAPTQPGAFKEVKVLSCYHQPGQAAYYDHLPEFAVGLKEGASQ